MFLHFVFKFSNQIFSIVFQIKKNAKCAQTSRQDIYEYELFAETLGTSVWNNYNKVNLLFYVCNLCSTKVNFICEFDNHLRSHTKFGHQVAVVGFIANILEEAPRKAH